MVARGRASVPPLQARFRCGTHLAAGASPRPTGVQFSQIPNVTAAAGGAMRQHSRRILPAKRAIKSEATFLKGVAGGKAPSCSFGYFPSTGKVPRRKAKLLPTKWSFYFVSDGHILLCSLRRGRRPRRPAILSPTADGGERAISFCSCKKKWQKKKHARGGHVNIIVQTSTAHQPWTSLLAA